METGEIELLIEDIQVVSQANPLPFPVAQEVDYPEEMRLRYRFLDLRKQKPHSNIVLRSKVISFLRQQMLQQDFLEIQTPILTASSPEGARDFLVPSRLNPGKFYALPQAPQQFKQLLMTSGFDKYFQIAPCFRDEDPRRDRAPGEFYQLDFEMAYVTQEEVFSVIEPILADCFKKFGKKSKISPTPFIRIPYRESIARFGTDKPDLRNPLELVDVTDSFKNGGFGLFAKLISQGAWVKAIKAPNSSEQPRRFFDKLNEWARANGSGGLGYIIFDKEGTPKGPIANNLEPERCEAIKQTIDANSGDAVFFICGKKSEDISFCALARDEICARLSLLDEDSFAFCWIIDYPLYEQDPQTGKLDFSHNPFSMPQGGLEALQTKDPLDILAYQYDIVCNGIELSSGAIRNHRPDIMKKVFAIAGYEEADLEQRFQALYHAFQYGAPPHGGAAPGIDRMIMLLAEEENIREVIAFPMNQRAQDLLMDAPSAISNEHLKELQLRFAPTPTQQKP